MNWTAIGAAAVLTLLGASPARPQEPNRSATNPLAPFERLVGGQWHLADSYQEFEWGVGKRSVKARSYFLVDGTPKLVSEGIWYWHPGDEKIKGVFTAVDMPVTFFDYTTRFDDNRMVSDLKSYGPKGDEKAYVEVWEFKDSSHFVWKLIQETDGGPQEVMSGTYARK